jgi:hypothetical protein
LLLKTAESIHKHISARFADSGLSQLASSVAQITREAAKRADEIRKPNWWLRAGLILLVAIAFAGALTYADTHGERKPFFETVFEFLDAAKGSAALLTAMAIFLWTLEVRLKRRRALQAVHELRGVAHVIDMHQLTKDPDRIGHATEATVVGSRKMNAEDMGRYLHFCTELLAIVSKMGQLYVQGFPDAVAQTAVDQFEALTTGLTSKIWQKLMVLDRIINKGAMESRTADAGPDHKGRTPN